MEKERKKKKKKEKDRHIKGKSFFCKIMMFFLSFSFLENFHSFVVPLLTTHFDSFLCTLVYNCINPYFLVFLSPSFFQLASIKTILIFIFFFFFYWFIFWNNFVLFFLISIQLVRFFLHSYSHDFRQFSDSLVKISLSLSKYRLDI